MKRVAATEARKLLANIIEDAYFGREVTFLTHYGEDRAAIVPADCVDVPEIESGKRKPAQSAQKRNPRPKQ